jgi:hypothetical protein
LGQPPCLAARVYVGTSVLSIFLYLFAVLRQGFGVNPDPVRVFDDTKNLKKFIFEKKFILKLQMAIKNLYL